jgi:hypothetical protein
MLDVDRMWQESGDGTVVLGRHLLRHATYGVLARAGAPLRVGEIVGELNRSGFVTWRPSSRAVSDALRTEVRRGRVIRLRRGVYVVERVDEAHLRYVDRVLGELRRPPEQRQASGTPWAIRRQRNLTAVSGTLPGHGVRPR